MYNNLHGYAYVHIKGYERGVHLSVCVHAHARVRVCVRARACVCVCVCVRVCVHACVHECACALGNICTYVPYLRIPWAVRNLKGQCLQNKYRKKNSVLVSFSCTIGPLQITTLSHVLVFKIRLLLYNYQVCTLHIYICRVC